METRYPVHWPTFFSLEEAQKSRAAAKRVQSFVTQKLEKHI
ncbi:MAG: hypothetical protein C4519_25105 [Desulfobacteraceae bacterium]|nr:MAG: hypothetical protein C4519_25105 [Desulfobacteraceae bacterium]